MDAIPLSNSFDKTLFFKRNQKQSAFFQLPDKSELINYRHASIAGERIVNHHKPTCPPSSAPGPQLWWPGLKDDGSSTVPRHGSVVHRRRTDAKSGGRGPAAGLISGKLNPCFKAGGA